MTDIHFYHDFRAAKPDEAAPLKYCFSHRGRTAYIKTDIKLTALQWDAAAEQVVSHPFAHQYNLMLAQTRALLEREVANLRATLELAGMSSKDVKDRLVYAMMGKRYEDERNDRRKACTFAKAMLARTEKTRAQGTREIYTTCYRRLQRFDSGFERRAFEDIDKHYLERLTAWMRQDEGCAVNTVAVQLRCMRAAFNEAIDEELTTFYPFRRFRVRTEATAKRALSIEQLRGVICGTTDEGSEVWQDVFRLIFYLIGINITDLCHLTQKNVRRGRLEYHRAKTGKLYSIKIEPEAMALLLKYRGKKYLLNFIEQSSFKAFFERLNTGLKKTVFHHNGERVRLDAELTTYWARHSWATTAAGLDIPKETISAALGHSMGSAITATYIAFDERKIDAANRRVIDYVLDGDESPQ